jgi:AcrR family transcriptional regulator
MKESSIVPESPTATAPAAAPASEAPPAGQDGRAARSRRTREAVIDALHALIAEGDPKPNAARIAERAGVSSRTIFAHFATLEDLYRATAERATALVISLLTPIEPTDPLDERIDSLCAQRARVNEEIGPLRRAAALQEPFSPALAEARRYGRQASRAQLERVLAAELAALDPATRPGRLATLDALISGESWDLLRTTHDLAPDEARRAVGAAVRALLPRDAAPATAATAGTGAAGAAGPSARGPSDEERARVAAAEGALEAVDQKVDRLVAALEAGSPPDLLAPRLQALRSSRSVAERELADARASAARPRD